MPWRSESVMEQRVKFVIEAQRKEKTHAALCREYGVSRPTGYLWLNRYKQASSLNGLQERSRRPHHSPGRTDRAIEELVLELRDKTGWGAPKLQFVLANKGTVMARATVHRILVREGRVGDERKSLKKATKRFARKQCNELAQMDFKGEYQLRGRQKCYPLSLLDDCSRYLHGLWPLPSTAGEGVYRSLLGHFKEVGVPQAMLMDHGTPWFSTQNQQGLTWVAVWLIKQGVVLKYSGVGHPQTQGKVERFHRTLKSRTKQRGVPATMSEWSCWAEEFRREYNHERPHESLNMKTPAEVYRSENLRPYQEHPHEWEYHSGNVKKLDGYGMLYFRGGAYFVCEALAHERVRIDQLDDKLVVTFRHLTIREIDLRTAKSFPVLLKL